MSLNFLTEVTKLLQIKLLRCIALVALCYVVNVLTNGALKPERKTCSFRFFCHVVNYIAYAQIYQYMFASTLPLSKHSRSW